MANRLSKADIVDLDLLDAPELSSDGNFLFLSTSCVSVVAGSITVSLASDGEGLLTGYDHPVEPGDIVRIVGSTAADGQYTIATVVSDTQFTVSTAIPDSTGGTVNYYYRAGALRIGVDASSFTHVSTSSTNLQTVLNELDLLVGGSSSAALTEALHPQLRQLIHLADGEGPFEGFATGAFQETLPAGTPFPTSTTWWTNSAKTHKIVEELVSYNPNKTIATDVWKVYDVDGSTVMAQVTDTITYSGVFETSRLRAIVDNITYPDYLLPDTHRTLRQLIHLADGGGPFEGFSSGAFCETLPAASPFPTTITWWTSAAMTAKIVDETISYNPNRTVSSVQWRAYSVDGLSILATVTDTITYSGVFEVSRTRAIV